MAYEAPTTAILPAGAVAQRNLEAKFPLLDRLASEQRALTVGFRTHSVIFQRDTFFVVKRGKLKLREEPDSARLIYYRRHDQAGLKVSDYRLVPVAEPTALRRMIGAALGVLAEVRKERTLMLRGNIRLHLDRVEGLGDFGEIEAVMPAGANPTGSRGALDEVLAALDVKRSDLIEGSYFELLG